LLGAEYRTMAAQFQVSVGALQRHKRHVVVIEGAVEHIRQRGREGATLNTIAAELGVTRQRFQELLKAKHEWLLAWEAGSAAHEQHLSELLESCITEKRNPVPAMFALKARYGWKEYPDERDKPPPSNVVIMLPGSMAPDQYLKLVQGQRLPAQQKALP
jgi:hypothetical protein